MFDNYYPERHVHQHTTQVVDRNITIHRAPTDESIKIYKELDEKARANFIGELKLEDNILKGVRMFMWKDPYMGYIIRCQYLLNNILIQYEVTIAPFEILAKYNTFEWNEFMVEKVKEETRNKLSELVLEQLFRNISGKPILLDAIIP